MKTNAARILEALGVRFDLREYEVDPEDLSAETVAAKVGLPAERVFKTLVCRGDRHGVCMAVIAGSAELDLKALARLTGDRKVETVPLKDLQPLTGFLRGGVTAIGGKKEFPVYVDVSAQAHPLISISAGARGTQILLSPSDYLRVVKAKVGVISRPKSGRPS